MHIHLLKSGFKQEKCTGSGDTEYGGALKTRPGVISAAGVGALIGQLTATHLQGVLVNRLSMTCTLAGVQY